MEPTTGEQLQDLRLELASIKDSLKNVTEQINELKNQLNALYGRFVHPSE